MALHVFSIVNSPPTALPIPSLWGIPVHQPEHLSHASNLVVCFSLNNIYVSMLFSQINPPAPSPMESKSPFYTPVSLFLSST